MSFTPHANQHICHLAHLHGLNSTAPWVQPGYRKSDAALRRKIAGKSPKLSGTEFQDLTPMLGSQEEQTTDAKWFERRWSLGEKESCATQSKRLAEEASALPMGDLLGGTTFQVTASTAIGWAYGTTTPHVVVAGLRTSGYMVALATIAAKLRPDLPQNNELTPYLRYLAEIHLAATALIRIPAFDSHVEALLTTAGKQLRPFKGGEGQARRWIRRIARIYLDQPPGEIGKITAGLHQNRTDRLHRAWSRGFFIPKGFNLTEWMASSDAT